MLIPANRGFRLLRVGFAVLGWEEMLVRNRVLDTSAYSGFRFRVKRFGGSGSGIAAETSFHRAGAPGASEGGFATKRTANRRWHVHSQAEGLRRNSRTI